MEWVFFIVYLTAKGIDIHSERFATEEACRAVEAMTDAMRDDEHLALGWNSSICVKDAQ